MLNESNLKFTIQVSEDLDASQRKSIGEEVIDQIIKRTREDNRNKDGRPFPKYSTKYTGSVDFKNAGKSIDNINLTLSGDMLDDLNIIKHGVGFIDIGYKPSYSGAGKVEGNVIGSYGQPFPRTSKARNFLGIQKDELSEIVDKYSVPEALLPNKEITDREIKRAIDAIFKNTVTNEID